jgi:TP901 family phage tail tape measure protein
MATTVSSLVVEVGSNIAALTTGLNTADSQVKGFAGQVSTSMQTLGGEVTKLGGAISTIAAPFAAGVGAAVYSAVEFDEAMTNVGAVLGMNREEMAGLSSEILAIGSNARAGPQAAAEAFYDIVGGVADASTHIAILNAAIATAEAGNADLTSTTNALISTMNSYGYSAEQAGMVSDTMTQVVAKGVGTMGDFAGALPQVTGLAASLNVPLNEVGGAMAYLTTQGNSASQAATQLSAMMTAMLNPNETMKAALEEMGFASGQAAIETLGLVGAYEALGETNTVAEEGLAKTTGSVEALRGATALTGEDVGGFLTAFTEGIEGATATAQEIQNASPAAQFDLLKSSVSELGIEVGEKLIPAMQNLFEKVEPVIDSVITWVDENPELVSQIGQVAIVAVGLGVGLMVVGSAIGAVGTIAGAVGAVISAVGWPVIALGAAVGLAIAVLNDPGIQAGLKAWEGVVAMVPGVMQAIAIKIDETFNDVAVSVRTFVRDVKGEVALAVGELAAAGQALGLGISDETVNNLAEEFASIDIAKKLEGALNTSMAAGGPLEFDIAQIRWITSGEAPPEFFDKLVSNIADPRLIQEALGSAINMGDAEVVDVLAPLALKFADDPKMQMQTLLDQAFTAGGEEGMAFQALVPMATELGIDVPALAEQMQAELTAMESEQQYAANVPVMVTLNPLFANLPSFSQTISNTAASASTGLPPAQIGPAPPPIPGAAGGAGIMSEGLVYAHAGERILNPAETANYESGGGRGGQGGNVVQIYGVQNVDALLAELYRRGIVLKP